MNRSMAGEVEVELNVEVEVAAAILALPRCNVAIIYKSTASRRQDVPTVLLGKWAREQESDE